MGSAKLLFMAGMAAAGLALAFNEIKHTNYGSGCIFIPKRHTIETYRSQQRKAKKRKHGIK